MEKKIRSYDVIDITELTKEELTELYKKINDECLGCLQNSHDMNVSSGERAFYKEYLKICEADLDLVGKRLKKFKK